MNTPRHIVVKLTKIKEKEKALKSIMEKQQITHKGIFIRLSDISFFLFFFFLAETPNPAGHKGVAQYILSDEREKSTTKNTLPRASWLCSGPASCSRSQEELHFRGATAQDCQLPEGPPHTPEKLKQAWPGHEKMCLILRQSF